MSQSDIAKIKAVIRRYADACNTGDVKALERSLSRDAVFMSPDALKICGNKAISAWAKGTFFKPFDNKLRIGLDRVRVFGGLAIGAGTFTLELTQKSGRGSMKGAGKHMGLFKKEKNGSWKYAQAIWNFNEPPG
jgi:uncharacterized protein (TIGR02246 family)